MRRRYVLVVALLGVAMVVLPTVAGSVEPTTNITAHNEPGVYSYHSWMPSTATVSLGGIVKFSNPYTTTYHGLKFTGGTAGTTPSCTGIPQQATEPIGAFHWEGECTFSKAGTYTFVCTVHPTEMKGTITVTNGEPTAITEAATPVTEHEATLNGTVNPEGHETSYFFKYGRTTSYENGPTPTGKLTAVKEGKAVFAPVMGLAPGTTYHFKLVAKNEKGPAEGEDHTFTTASPPGPPTATTGEATSVSETEATLKGTVNPDGKPTKSFFEWGTSNSYGQVTAEVPAGEDHANHAASAILMALSPGTVYHFRLVAKNTSSETVPGVDQMLKTAPPPLSPLANPSPPIATPSSMTPGPTIVPMAPIEPLSGSPLLGGPLLRSNQRGPSVRGSLDVSQAGAGGRLEVDLLAKSATLAQTRRSGSGSVRVGRLVRASVSAGKVSFSISLNAKARHTLSVHKRLALTVKITLTPAHGVAVTVTRSVVLRA